MTVHVGEAEVAALVAVGKLGVVDAQLVQESGVEVMDVHGAQRPFVLGRLGPTGVD